ncbi:putative polygalacturonase At3g15720 [Bidens hawaiensis]|uniref:putative polygalacturonase At3g15720 n=1 Tax=Bidens hawaiensis TaxID=980011 RepID=UPI00404B4097
MASQMTLRYVNHVYNHIQYSIDQFLFSKHIRNIQAFVRAWENFCADISIQRSPQLIIPKDKKFLIHCVQFKGPCSSPTILITLLGEIIAPTSLDGWKGCDTEGHLISFVSVKGLIIDGPGHIDGQGAIWWGGGDIKPAGPTSEFPSLVLFQSCNGLHLRRRTGYINSPNSYISIRDCQDADIGNINVRITGKFEKYRSYTTGIDISWSSHVNIHDTYIYAGGGCVTISGGANDINVTGITCAGGHGISIGSFGRYAPYTSVEKVLVRRITFFVTQTVARIKTLPYANGYVRLITFEDIKEILGAPNPIVIDQHYCTNMSNPECPAPPTASFVQVSDVTYRNIEGYTTSKQAIFFNCAGQFHSCTGIVTNNVTITGEAGAYCQNVLGNFTHTTPQIVCK